MRPARGPVRRRLQLLVQLVATWRPTWPRARAAARSVLTSTLALGGSLWFVPGPQVRTAGSVVLLAIAVLLLGVLLRPLLTSLTVLAGSVGMLVAGVLSQALLLGLALSVVPGLEPFSVPEIVVVSWVAAAVAAVVNWLFDAGSEDAFLAQVLGRAVRQAHLHPEATGPGLLVVQLDGVSEPLLRQALTAGAMPTLSRWLRSGSHVLHRWHTGLPATTPAGQAVLLHGDVHAVPSFRWYDKEQGRMLVASHPADLAEVERGLSDGCGLLADGGASVSNLFSGDAAVTVLTMSDARLPSADRGAASFANARFGFVRSIVLFVGQVATEWHQGRRQRLRDVRPRVHRGGAFVLLRGLTTVVLRDLNVSIVAEQMARGTPVVFCDFVDYDEVAHHAGPSRPESMRQLDGLDRVLQFFERVGREVTRSYEIAIVSDHGQSQGTTFLQRTGRTLDDVVRSLLPDVATGSVEPARRPAHASETYGPANVLLTGAARSDRIVGAAARTAMRRRDGDRDELTVDRSPSPATPERVVVAASGSLAHVYVTDEPGRVPLERVEARCPGLVAGLAGHDGVGAVVGRTADGVLRVVGPDGWRDLVDGRTTGGAGVDPLAVYGDAAATDLLQLDRREHVGDLVVLGAYDPRLDEVTAFEELVGSHGGLGGSQTEALLVHPGGWTPLPDALDGPAVHAALTGRLVQLGLRSTATGTVAERVAGPLADPESARVPGGAAP